MKKESLWKPIEELGTMSKNQDGVISWHLFDGYEKMRLFIIFVNDGHETYYGNIDEDGLICDMDGEDIGFSWYQAAYFMDIPEF